MVAAIGLMGMVQGAVTGQATPMLEEQVEMDTVQMPPLLVGYMAALNAHNADAVAG